MSLKARLVAVVSVLVLVGLVVADVATYTALRSFLLKRVDQQLDGLHRPVDQALAFTGGDPAVLRGSARFDTFTGAAPFFQVRDARNQVLGTVVSRPADERTFTPRLPSRLPVAAASEANQAEEARTFTVSSAESGGPRFRVRVSTVPDTGQVLVVALPLRDVTRTLNRLKLIESLVTAAVALAVAGIGLWLVRIGLRPLTGIGRTAEAIAGGDLTQRVTPSEPRTEVGRLGQALNVMLGRIEAAFAERQASEDRLRRFVADASHELRTPLTSIRGYAELFRRGAASHPDDLAKAMSRIEEEADRMGLLVEDLLLLARLDQGRPLERAPVDLAALAAQAVSDAQVVEPDRPLTFEASGEVTVVGDAARLRQVIDNLLANVRTHTPPATPAHVRVGANEENALLEMGDEGPGLEHDQRQRVFERFYRADPSRSRRSGGLGLGLSIVAAIVEAHGGRVDVSSDPGHGATFRIELPLTGADGAADAPSPPAVGTDSTPEETREAEEAADEEEEVSPARD